MRAYQLTRGFELLDARSWALDDIQRFGEQKRPERGIVAPHGALDARQLDERLSSLVDLAGAPMPVLQATRQQLRRRLVRRGVGRKACAS
jgi:hypothetical protein